MKHIATIGDKLFIVELGENGEVWVNDQRYEAEVRPITDLCSAIQINQTIYEVVVAKREEKLYEVNLAGERHIVLVQDELSYRVAQAQESALHAQGSVTLKAPMPGVIVRVMVQIGETVQKGQTLVILESMKMENELKSPRTGVVETVFVAAGTAVEKEQKLLVIGD